MPPQNFPIIDQALSRSHNGEPEAFKQVKQICKDQPSFSVDDVLDIDELISMSTEQQDNYQQVVSTCLSQKFDPKQRQAMFDLLAKNINMSGDSSVDSGTDCMLQSVSVDSRSSCSSPTPDSSSSSIGTAGSVASLSSSSSTSSCPKPTRKVKERQRRRPRRYKYNPKPLIEKAGRGSIPNELKDEEYWERRNLNNQAARKTREERRVKELEVLRTIERLQNDNDTLRDYLTQLEEKNRLLVAKFKKREAEL